MHRTASTCHHVCLVSSSMEDLGIAGPILTPSSGQVYLDALRRHNSDLSCLLAKHVVQPTAYTDIVKVIQFAAAHTPPLELAIKGGGAHSSTWASSDGGIVIDLCFLNKVTLPQDKQSITVQGGALWGDVYQVCRQGEVDVPGGPFWLIGVGGFTLGGGRGPLSGERGLVIDNLIDATVVLADGRIVKADANQEPDLFWAIRGGGGNFGVVTE